VGIVVGGAVVVVVASVVVVEDDVVVVGRARAARVWAGVSEQAAAVANATVQQMASRRAARSGERSRMKQV
jgi:hypothetical protein